MNSEWFIAVLALTTLILIVRSFSLASEIARLDKTNSFLLHEVNNLREQVRLQSSSYLTLMEILTINNRKDQVNHE